MKKWVYELIAVVAAGAVLYYLYVEGYLSFLIGGSGTGTGGSGTGTGGSGTGTGGSSWQLFPGQGDGCTYPVDCTSPPNCIRAAMDASGYSKALVYNAADYQDVLYDPVSYLRNHPELAQTYPKYFS